MLIWPLLARFSRIDCSMLRTIFSEAKQAMQLCESTGLPSFASLTGAKNILRVLPVRADA
jgi:hypothetical protein